VTLRKAGSVSQLSIVVAAYVNLPINPERWYQVGVRFARTWRRADGPQPEAYDGDFARADAFDSFSDMVEFSGYF